MAGMGPPPKPGARRPNNGRQNDGMQVVAAQLPAAGRPGKPPKWPLPGRMLAGELDAWRSAWATPQAAEWERLGWDRMIARYVRILVESEQPEATAATRGEVRQLEDRLGLSPMSMLRLRWSVVDADADDVSVAPAKTSARERLRVV